MNDYELSLKADITRLNAEVAILESKFGQAQAEVASLTNQLDMTKALAKSVSDNCDRLRAQIDAVDDALRRASTEVDHEAFKEMYEDIAEAIGFEMTREVEVTITMSQTVTVKVPFGEEVSDSDFWATRGEVLESNYTIENEQDIEIEDVTSNRW